MRDLQREREIVEAAYSDYLAEIKRIGNRKDTIPHCDNLVLHAPGRCTYCDGHPEWQQARIDFRIAFTGEDPKNRDEYKLRPCPAEVLRPVETIERWYGNVPV